MNNRDVVVLGAGNAAFCAAHAAREIGASVLMLECAPKDENGGNSRFAAGAIRFAFDDMGDIRALCPDLSDEQSRITDFGAYPADQFYDDMFRSTRFRCDPALCERLVTESRSVMFWLRRKGIRFAPMYGRRGVEVDGRFKFRGGPVLEAWGGGPGLVDAHTKIAGQSGIDIRYGARALDLILDGCVVTGVRIKHEHKIETVSAKAVVLATGGFQANTEWRTRYLGSGWEMARVRGSRFNTGDGIRMAVAAGASTQGHWSGCHAVGWDYSAPEFGDLTSGNNYHKRAYPLGIMVNALGRRFVDEGADFWSGTYAEYGRLILEQPNLFAWQVFDGKVSHLLWDEYRAGRAAKVEANTLQGLVGKMEGVDERGFLEEVARFNAAVRTDIPFDPSTRDGRCTTGLPIAKSNWANTVDQGPFEAYQVGCGITSTFGGLRIAPESGQVLDTDLCPIPGLYAAGELVGGLFYFSYPGGAGLMNGSVFGHLAGSSAALAAAG